MDKRIPIKAIGGTVKADGERRISGYLVRFTSPDDLDLHDEYFAPDTDFMLAEYPIKGKPILAEHGLDERFGVIPIGLFNFVDETDLGIYVEGRLNDVEDYERYIRERAKRYKLTVDDAQIRSAAELAVKAVDALFKTGKAHFSSGALPQSVKVDMETGKILQWAIIEGSATLTPAEPDGTEIVSKLRKALTLQGGLTDSKEGNVEALIGDVAPTDKLCEPKDKTMNAEQKARFRSMLEELISALSEDMDMAEEEKAEALEIGVEEADKADGMANPDEEEMKKFFNKNLQALATAIVNGISAKREARAAVMRQAAKSAVSAAKARPANGAPSGSYPNADAQTQSRISVGEERKYAHLDARDMAATAQLMQALVRKANPMARIADVVRPEFLATMANKAKRYADTNPYDDFRSNESLKSTIPFKANELDASTIATQGDEWVGEFWATELWERARYATAYDNLVGRGMLVREIPRGSESAKFPLEGNDPVAYSRPQATSIDATGRPEITAQISPFNTGQVVVTPGEIAVVTAWTDILDEDSVIAVAPQVNRQLGLKIRETRDQVLLNGDTATSANTNINLIDGTPATGRLRPYYLASDGFRKLPLVTLTSQSRDAGTTLGIDDFRATLALLSGELRQFRERMLFIIDPDTEMAALALPEIASDDVRRTNATITSGVLQNIYGVDVNTNGFLPRSNATGRVSATPGNNTRGTILLVYAPYWGVAYKRQITFEVDRDALSGTNIAIATMRMGVMARGTNAAALSYNVGSYA